MKEEYQSKYACHYGHYKDINDEKIEGIMIGSKSCATFWTSHNEEV